MKKFLTTLLCLVLAFTMMPIITGAVFAAGTELTGSLSIKGNPIIEEGSIVSPTGAFWECTTDTNGVTLIISATDEEVPENESFIESELNVPLDIIFEKDIFISATDEGYGIKATNPLTIGGGKTITIYSDENAITTYMEDDTDDVSEGYPLTIKSNTTVVASGTGIEADSLDNYGTIIIKTNDIEYGIKCHSTLTNYQDAKITVTGTDVNAKTGIDVNDLKNNGGKIVANGQFNGLYVRKNLENSGTIEAKADLFGLTASVLEQNAGTITAEGMIGIFGKNRYLYNPESFEGAEDEVAALLPDTEEGHKVKFIFNGGKVKATGKMPEGESYGAEIAHYIPMDISVGIFSAGELIVPSDSACEIKASAEGDTTGYHVGLIACILNIQGGKVEADVSDFSYDFSISTATATNTDDLEYLTEYNVYAPIASGIPSLMDIISRVGETSVIFGGEYPTDTDIPLSETPAITVGSDEDCDICVNGLKTFMVSENPNGSAVNSVSNYAKFCNDIKEGKYRYAVLEYGEKEEEIQSGGGYFDKEAYQKQLKKEKDEEIKALTQKMKVTLRTENKKNGIKVYVKDNAKIEKAKSEGYKVVYDFYRAEGNKAPKNSKYKITKVVDKVKPWYLNTAVKKGHKYYYKAVAKVLDEDGNIIATTELTQGFCGYRTR